MAMARKKWIVLSVAAVLLLTLLIAAAAAGAYLYLQYRNRQWLRLAQDTYAQGDWKLASIYYQWYLPHDPTNEAALRQYADANLHLLDNRRAALASAATAYRQILDHSPGNQEVLDILFKLYERTGSWLQLEYYASLVLRDRPDDAQFLSYRAEALDELGRRDEAIAAYRQLVESGKASPGAYGNLARLLSDRGYAREAQGVLDAALEHFKGNPVDGASSTVPDTSRDGSSTVDEARIHAERAKYFASARNWTQVESELAEAARLAPDDIDVLAAETQGAVSRKDWDRVISLCDEAIAKAPERGGLYLTKVLALTRKGEMDAAVAYLAGLEPSVRVDNPELMVTLADLQIAMKRFDDSANTVAAYRKAYPTSTDMLDYLLAREAMAKGDYSAAAQKLASVVGRRPDFTPALFSLALAYQESGQTKLARSTLEAYLRKRPDDTRARALMATGLGATPTRTEVERFAAEILARQRDDQTAADPRAYVSTAVALFDACLRQREPEARLDMVKELFERAIAGDPQWSPAYMGLADVFVTVKDYAAAREVLERATAAGIQKDDLAQARARMALAEGRADDAWSLCQEHTARTNASVDDYLAWSTMFATRGEPRRALDVLDQGLARAQAGGPGPAGGWPSGAEPDGSRSGAGGDTDSLKIERVLLTARMGDTARALELIDGLKDIPRPNARLNAAILDVAKQLLASGGEAAPQQAGALVDEVRKEDPEDPRVLTFDAELFLRQTPPDLVQAKALYDRATDMDPSNPDALLGLAHIASLQGDVVQAANYAERAVSLAPNLIGPELELAEAKIKLGSFFDAEKILTGLLVRIENAPAHKRPAREGSGETGAPRDRSMALRLLVLCYTAGNRIPDAEAALKRLQEAVGDSTEWAKELAALQVNLLAAKGQTSPDAARQAETALRSQYAGQPDDFSLAQRLAACVNAQGRPDEAEGILKEYVNRHQTDAEPWLTLAMFYIEPGGAESTGQAGASGRTASASAALTRALMLDPNYLPALRGMIEVQARRGNVPEALALCDRCLQQQPDDAAILSRKASLLVRLRGPSPKDPTLQLALETINRAIALDSRPDCLAMRGMILLAMQDYQGALKDLQPLARAQGKTTAEIDAALAEAYVATGQFDLARERYDAALQKVQQGQTVQPGRLERIAQKLEENQK